MEQPELTGSRRVIKNVFDRTAAAFGIVLLLWLLIVLALGVKFTSPGPVLFRHERIGKGGQPYSAFKFRSMVVGADGIQQDLFDQNEGNDVQFKMKRVPRLTRIGAIMRRYSLDELSRLSNVLNGSMSLVGPRPYVTPEVQSYDDDLRRCRLLVKPGITGLAGQWPVRPVVGRLSPDRPPVRRELVAGDGLMILFKTVGSVLRGSGAY